MKYKKEKIFKIIGIFLMVFCIFSVGKVEAKNIISNLGNYYTEGMTPGWSDYYTGNIASFKKWYEQYDTKRVPEATIVIKHNNNYISEEEVAKLKPGEKIIISVDVKNNYNIIGEVGCYLNGDHKRVLGMKGATLEYEIPLEINSGKFEFLTYVTYINTYEASYDVISKMTTFNPYNFMNNWGWWDIVANIYTVEEAENPIIKNKEVIVTVNGATKNPDDSIIVKKGDKIEITAEPSDKVKKITYQIIGVTEEIEYNGVITIPSNLPAGEYTLIVKVSYIDGSTEERKYNIIIKDEQEKVENKDVIVKVNGEKINPGTQVEVKVGDEIEISGTPSSEVEKLIYDVGGLISDSTTSSTCTITIPAYMPVGEYELIVNALFSDGLYLGDSVTENNGKAYDIKLIVDNIYTDEIVVMLNGEIIEKGSEYKVKVGDIIQMQGYTKFTYSFGFKVGQVAGTLPASLVKDTIEITSDLSSGVKHTLTVKNTSIEDKYYFILENGETEVSVVENKDVIVKVNGEKINPDTQIEVKAGDEIEILGTPSSKVEKLIYDVGGLISDSTTSSTCTITIPAYIPAGEYELIVNALFSDGLYLGDSETENNGKVYKIEIVIEDKEPEVNIVTNKKITLELNGEQINRGTTVEVEAGEKITIKATPANSVKKIYYKWADETIKEISRSSDTFTIPSDSKVGERYLFMVNALYTDGLYIDDKTESATTSEVYYFEIIDGQEDEEPTSDEDRELIRESWMKENDDVKGLSISLRNDSEEDDKANKNIYELGETVTYYIDYKNGGKDITDEVSIVLELPLDYEKVDLDNGEINSYDEIEWVFEDGLDENEVGTIVVSVKYTSLEKSRDTSNTIYPTVSIRKGNSVKDISTCINTIISSYDKDLEIDHYPYMFGDAGTYTFRPDYSITRAEGALVLVRIFGVDYRNITDITTRYTDINETYYEAQQAITAATNLALVNGYLENDETYTFRPNAKITKAEFMKILASMIQVMAKEQDIEGLEVKSTDSLVKVYDDTYNKNTGKFHWAASEITSLARLNMLPLGDNYENFDIEDQVTRAEVTQLINFYLLRAPANVTSKTNIGFTDLSRNHELIEDIVEATRESHTYSITDDVKEN